MAIRAAVARLRFELLALEYCGGLNLQRGAPRRCSRTSKKRQPRTWGRERGSGPSPFLRYAPRHLGLLTAFLITGFVVGLSYRGFIDETASRSVANYVRSGLHGTGIALTAWAVQAGFARMSHLARAYPVTRQRVIITVPTY